MPEDFARYLIDDERWLRILSNAAQEARPALFLDRDGVMIEDMNYLSDPNGISLFPGCGEVLRKAGAAGVYTVVVTNQSGIGRGYFGWADYFRVECKLIELLKREGAVPDAILANSAAGEHVWRKPNPGMLLAAAEVLNIDLGRSLIAGDKASDLEAGRHAGLSKGVHVSTGHGKCGTEAVRKLATARFKVECLSDIQAFAARFDEFL